MKSVSARCEIDEGGVVFRVSARGRWSEEFEFLPPRTRVCHITGEGGWTERGAREGRLEVGARARARRERLRNPADSAAEKAEFDWQRNETSGIVVLCDPSRGIGNAEHLYLLRKYHPETTLVMSPSLLPAPSSNRPRDLATLRGCPIERPGLAIERKRNEKKVSLQRDALAFVLGCMHFRRSLSTFSAKIIGKQDSTSGSIVATRTRLPYVSCFSSRDAIALITNKPNAARRKIYTRARARASVCCRVSGAGMGA